MELQFVGKPIHCLERVVWDVQELEQTQEVRLPEDMPDIGNIVCAWGQCVLRGKEWHSDRIGVSGGVMAWVMYIPADDSEPRCVEVWLPMQGKWSMPDTKMEGAIRTKWLLSGVDGRMLSARKMLVRANAQVLAEAMAPGQAEVLSPAELPEDVQLLKKTYLMQLPKEAGEKTFQMEEEMVVSGMEKPVCVNVNPTVREQIVVGGKAVFRGDARIHLVYKGADGMLCSADRELPFSQFADLDRDYDKEATLCAMPAVSNMEMEQTEGAMLLKITLVMQYLVYDREQVDIYEDAYSNLRKTECRKQPVKLPMELDRMRQRMEVGVELPANGRTVDVSLFPRHCAVHSALQLHELENCGSMQVVYYDESGRLCADVERYNAAWEVPGDCAVLGMLKDTEQPRLEGNAVRSEVELEAVAVSGDAMEMLAGMELGELVRPDPARPSLILRRAGKCDLWEIAKESGSTMDAIAKANGLDGDPGEDRMLLIPVV